jgi:hypothetical protein
MEARGAAMISDPGVPKSAALRALYWRSEILQLLYWLRGEGLGDLVDAALLERFLGVDAGTAIGHLDRLADEGYLDRDGEWFALSAMGLQEGALELATAFAELNRPADGDCSADCWCHVSAEEAAACAAERGGNDH